MADLRTGVLKILADARADIQANMQARGVNASGRTSASMRVEETKQGARLVGGDTGKHSITVAGITLQAYNTAPIPTLQTGAAPWANKPKRVPFWFAAMLYQWTIDKGIGVADDRARIGMAYAIGKKVINKGTGRYTSPVDIYTTAGQVAADKIRALVLQETRSNIKAALAVTNRMK